MQWHRAQPEALDRQGHRRTRRARGFTLVELMVTIAVISIIAGLGTFAFRGMREGAALAQAKNAVLTYAAAARTYAIANHIETMFVVNPYNGHFEIWYLNPPPNGGPWDPYSSGDLAQPDLADGYAYAPHVLDAKAGLPLDGNGRPLAVVHPIDYNDPTYRPLINDAEERNLDNLIWAAFCFDQNGKLVTRTRRIATRSSHLRNGRPRPGSLQAPNRLDDETPDLEILKTEPLVTVLDTPITSTRGFVISEFSKMKLVTGIMPTPSELVNQWLFETRTGGAYVDFAETVVMDRFSGQQLTGEK
jgi:prepilin-type N-terminal cleavage/methylation domain-containing protein